MSSISEVPGFVIPHSWKHSQLPLQICTAWEEGPQTFSEYVVSSVQLWLTLILYSSNATEIS